MRSIVLFLLLGSSFAQAVGSEGPDWIRDDRAAFTQARAGQRFVLLYLEATWCHWCHVMDHDTYGDAAVRKLIDAHYVPLRIDQDARPDLANRYRDYGWPATIVLAADGSEIVKRRGYIAPEPFARLLQAIVDDPSPEHAAAIDTADPTPRSTLDDKTRAELLRRHRESFDHEKGGLATAQKFLDRDQVEYSLELALAGDAAER